MANFEQTGQKTQGVDNPFRKLKLSFDQDGVDEPVLRKVFENELRYNQKAPVLARTGVGAYTLTVTNGFEGDVFMFSQMNADGAFVKLSKVSSSVININVFDAAGVAIDLSGSLQISIEVF